MPSATMLHLTDVGIKPHTHMLSQELFAVVGPAKGEWKLVLSAGSEQLGCVFSAQRC